MIQFSRFLSNNSTTIQIKLSKCYWFHDIEKLNVFKNCKMEDHPCNIARVVQPCKTWKVETHIGGLPKNGASSPHLWTFICTQQNTQFDVSTKTHLHKNGASGTHRWTFKDNFISHNTLAMWTYTWEHRLCPHGLFSGRTNYHLPQRHSTWIAILDFHRFWSYILCSEYQEPRKETPKIKTWLALIELVTT